MSSDTYIELPIETDPSLLAQDAYDYLAANIDGWNPSSANLESWLIEALAAMIAEARDVASAVPKSIFRYFGATLLGLPPTAPEFAVALTTWTLRDEVGYTIPVGTAFTLATSDGLNLVFELTDDAVLAADSGTTIGGVQARALDSGEIGSGLTSVPRLLDILDYVVDVTLDSPTTGGVDGETDDDYLNRLSRRLQLLTPRPILPRDFAILARENPLVMRATAINGYNPGDDTDDNERTVAVAVHDSAGAALSGPVKTEIETYLEALREVNFIVHVMDPTFSVINVTFVAVAHPGWDIASVEAAATTNVEEFLNPVKWGNPNDGPFGLAASLEWTNETVLRYLELAQAINATEGLNYITGLSFGIRHAATAAAGTDIVTVTGHGYSVDDPVVFAGLTGGAGLVAGTTYYVRDVTTDTFKVAAAPGGGAVNITTDLTVATIHRAATTDVTMSGVAPLPQPGTVDGTVNAAP